jgi:hypothetical protein
MKKTNSNKHKHQFDTYGQQRRAARYRWIKQMRSLFLGGRRWIPALQQALLNGATPEEIITGTDQHLDRKQRKEILSAIII